MKQIIVTTLAIMACLWLFTAQALSQDEVAELDYVAISPESAKVAWGGTVQFTAKGYDEADNELADLTFAWIVTRSGGSIDAEGLFIAGLDLGFYENTVQVKATQGSVTKTANASVTVSNPVDVEVTISELPTAGGYMYTFRVENIGIETCYSFDVGYSGDEPIDNSQDNLWAYTAEAGTISWTETKWSKSYPYGVIERGWRNTFPPGQTLFFYFTVPEQLPQVDWQAKNIDTGNFDFGSAKTFVDIPLSPLDMEVTISELPTADGYMYTCRVENIGVETCYSFDVGYSGDERIYNSQDNLWAYTAEAGAISWTETKWSKSYPYGVIERGWRNIFPPGQTLFFYFIVPEQVTQVDWQAKNIDTGNLDFGSAKTFVDISLSPFVVAVKVSAAQMLNGHLYTFLVQNTGEESCDSLLVRYDDSFTEPVDHSEPSGWNYSAEAGAVSWTGPSFKPGEMRSFSLVLPQQSPRIDWKATNTSTGNLNYGLHDGLTGDKIDLTDQGGAKIPIVTLMVEYDEWKSGVLEFQAEARDPDGSVREVLFQYSLDDKAWHDIGRDVESPYSVGWDTTSVIPTADDSVWVKAVATDDAGLTGEDVIDVSFGVDNEPPITSNDYDSAWHSENIVITLTGDDKSGSGIAHTNYRVNDGEEKSVSADGQPGIDTEGDNNKVEYWSIDNVGNVEERHVLSEIKLDKIEPTLSDWVANPEDLTSAHANAFRVIVTALDAGGSGHIRRAIV